MRRIYSNMIHHYLSAAALIVAAFLIFMSGTVLNAQQARISEKKQVFRTYPFGDPNPLANIGRIYPYFRFDGYSAESTEQEWNIVTLENPYITVMVAPEIGGKILGAVEKSTGKAFIYYNKVIKFRDIGMRGPWTSGGIELNFGSIGHTPATSTPVDYLLRTNEDGSVSCVVGTMDITSRTEWRVEIRLPADKAYFETRGLWYNPTVLSTSQYQWMNGAADAGDDLRFYHPGQYHIDHGGNAYPWPVDEEGRDISLYGNNNFGPSKSYHVLGTYDGYFGGYYENSDFGFGHWSLYEDKPGKKIWLWALSRSGAIWEDLLTDTDLGNRQYVEIQTGLLLNQAGSNSSLTPFKHLSFAPNSDLRFNEAWFPVKDIGGIAEANLYGSLNVVRERGGLKIGICPLQDIDDELTITVGGRQFFERRLRLKPMEVFLETLSQVPDGDMEISLGGGKLAYRSGDKEERILTRPVTANKEFDWESVAGLYTDGAEKAKQRDYDGALEKYLACLGKDPVYSPALVGAADIHYRRMEYETALGYAMKALANDAYDPDANFIYGAISRKLGKLYDAKDGFGFAAKSPAYRSAANAQLAEIFFGEGDMKLAEEFSRRALEYNIYNMNALRIQALTFRKQGRSQAAGEALKRILHIDPLSHFANFESYLLSGDSRDREHFQKMVRPELPHEIYMELAIGYYNLGCLHEAANVLEHAPSQPIISLWLAHIHEKIGNASQSAAKLREALASSPFLVFPFRAETADVLEWAARKTDNWKLDYYRALVYWSKGRKEDAGRLFAKCGEAPDYAPFYAIRAEFFRESDTERAGDNYLKALSLDKSQWRYYHLLSGYFNEEGKYDRSLEYAKAGAEKFPRSYVLNFDYAMALLYTGDYAGCLDILESVVILPHEGARYGHDTYRSACIMGALEKMRSGGYREALSLVEKARQWPENLGVGKPYDADERIEDFVASLCYRGLGDAGRAERVLRNIISYTESAGTGRGSAYYLYALSLHQLGMRAEAEKAMADWLRNSPSSVPAQWARLHFAGKEEEARNLMLEFRTQEGGTPWNPAGGDAEFRLITEVVEAMR